MVTPSDRICSRKLPGLIAPAIPDFDRSDIGADRADIVGLRFASNARASSEVRTIAASDKSADQPCWAVR